jgi:hypothetical protein
MSETVLDITGFIVPGNMFRTASAGEYWDLGRIEETYDSADRFMQGATIPMEAVRMPGSVGVAPRNAG